MCGICGISTTPNTIDATRVTRTLLHGIEHRGRHATGITVSGADIGTHTTKDNVPARPFTDGLHVPNIATVILGHTRFATKGSPTDNDNNHPIVVPTDNDTTIHGVHNGCLWNDDDLFDLLDPNTRIAQVDSEAAFAWIGRSGAPTIEALEDILGSAALAWVDTTNPDLLHLARVDSSPLLLAHTVSHGLMFASTDGCLKNAARAAGADIKAITTVDEGTYLQVQFGRIIHRATFTPPLAANTRTLTAAEKLALG